MELFFFMSKQAFYGLSPELDHCTFCISKKSVALISSKDQKKKKQEEKGNKDRLLANLASLLLQIKIFGLRLETSDLRLATCLY